MAERNMQLASDALIALPTVRHVVYLNEGGWEHLEGRAEALGVVSAWNSRTSVSGMFRLINSGYLRVIRGDRFYAITDEDSIKYGIDRKSLLQRRIIL